MKTDAAKIAETTGLDKQAVQEIKNHLFLKEHDLGDSGIKRFDSDYMIAQSWQRLIVGKPKPHDLTLLRHESMEKELMSRGYTQDEAHILTSKKYSYEKEAYEFYGKIKKYRKE